RIRAGSCRVPFCYQFDKHISSAETCKLTICRQRQPIIGKGRFSVWPPFEVDTRCKSYHRRDANSDHGHQKPYTRTFHRNAPSASPSGLTARGLAISLKAWGD